MAEIKAVPLGKERVSLPDQFTHMFSLRVSNSWTLQEPVRVSFNHSS